MNITKPWRWYDTNVTKPKNSTNLVSVHTGVNPRFTTTIFSTSFVTPPNFSRLIFVELVEIVNVAPFNEFFWRWLAHFAFLSRFPYFFQFHFTFVVSKNALLSDLKLIINLILNSLNTR